MPNDTPSFTVCVFASLHSSFSSLFFVFFSLDLREPPGFFKKKQCSAFLLLLTLSTSAGLFASQDSFFFVFCFTSDSSRQMISPSLLLTSAPLLSHSSDRPTESNTFFALSISLTHGDKRKYTNLRIKARVYACVHVCMCVRLCVCVCAYQCRCWTCCFLRIAESGVYPILPRWAFFFFSSEERYTTKMKKWKCHTTPPPISYTLFCLFSLCVCCLNLRGGHATTSCFIFSLSFAALRSSHRLYLLCVVSLPL